MIGFPKTATDFSHFESCLFSKELQGCFERQKKFYLNNSDFFSKKTEAWKYFPFREWIDQKWDFNESKAPVERQAVSPCLPSSLFVSLQNGKLFSSLQKKGLFLCSWKDFLNGKAQLDEEKTKKILLTLEKQRDPFCSLNNICGEGFILVVREPLEQPLEIHYIQDEEKTFPSFNLRNFIFLEEKASAQILELFHGEVKKQNLFLNVQTDCFLSEKAFLEHIRLDQTNDRDVLINQCFAELSPLSKACFFSLGLNSGISRWHTELEQKEKSVSEIRGLSLLDDKKHADHKVSVRHYGMEGVSRQLYKSFLFDSAKQIFQGFVSIEKQAQRSDADQLSKNFLFGRGALAVAFPELDISADDVKAQHGATVSSFKENKDMFFYLQSRGIDSLQAFHLVLSGLIEDSLSCLQTDIKKVLRSFIAKKLNKLKSSFL